MKTILAIAANPDGTSVLKLNQELRDIRDFLAQAKYRDQFDLEERTAARWEDLQRAILEIRPRIVHFCGHGTGESGLVLEQDCGQPLLIKTDVLSDLFQSEIIRNTVECIVLNACYSVDQAKAIAQHINYVIGMSRAIPDQDAIAYAKGFYLGLGAGCSISQAHDQGLLYMRVEGQNNSHRRDIEISSSQDVANTLIPRIYIKESLTPFVDACGKPEGEKLTEGFVALETLLSNPAVYESVVIFKADLEVVYSRVETLSYYKQLHDLLQAIETKCYWPIFRYKQRFIGDEEGLMMLSEYEMNLQSSIVKAHSLVDQHSQDDDETPRWIKELETVRDKLESAISQSSEHDINQALRSLSRILSTEPICLNANLTSIAKTLRLSDLIRNLSVVRDKIIAENMTESDHLAKFELGLSSLASISDQLGHFVKEHDAWQRVDSELRVFANGFAPSVLDEDNLNDLSDLQEKVNSLCQGKLGAEVTRLEQCRQGLCDALTLKEPTKVRASFYRYYAAALDVFVQVDLALLHLCEELRDIRTALAPVMEKLS
ncbi:MAG: CHAT domain-containing protein [Spirulina sp.]